MLIAHLPAGYIMGRFWPQRRAQARAVMAAALIGSVIPDIDLLLFVFVDRTTHHHDYTTHWPIVWLAGLLACFIVGLWRPHWLAPLTVFFAAALVHMVLDSFASPIGWQLPFSTAMTEMVRVPAVYSHWPFNFILYWTFIPEIMICVAALAVLLRDRRSARTAPAGMG